MHDTIRRNCPVRADSSENNCAIFIQRNCYMNVELLDRMHGEPHVLFGDDTAEIEDPTVQDIRITGLPLSKLHC